MERTVLLALHIACAASLFGGTLAARLAREAVRGAADGAALRGALDVLQRAARANPAFALGLLASGVLLEHLAQAEQEVTIGAVIARIGSAADYQPAAPSTQAAAPAASPSGQRVSPLAQRIARDVKGVKGVRNEIALRP